MMVQFTNMPYLDEPIIPKESLAFKGQKLSRTTMVKITKYCPKIKKHLFYQRDWNSQKISNIGGKFVFELTKKQFRV